MYIQFFWKKKEDSSKLQSKESKKWDKERN